ncbi:hypothetical protein [Streptomyces sp. 3214.6]|uniref:hypothetical protein n=1 Tax=Streptomyces sp. 3214.6 TaxID=1882757 RepID=UPI0009A71B4D|nr:hypothetical protein [Streptomyces sp. 3214.6]
MTEQALTFYRENYLPEPSYSPFVAMVRKALSDTYADKAVGVNPYDEIIGVASKQFNKIQDYALSHQGDDQPQMHQELGDDR